MRNEGRYNILVVTNKLVYEMLNVILAQLADSHMNLNHSHIFFFYTELHDEYTERIVLDKLMRKTGWIHDYISSYSTILEPLNIVGFWF